MTLVFDFLEVLNWNWFQWLLFIIFIATFFFLTIGCSDLKRCDFSSTKLLFIAGIILLIWKFVEIFIPTVSGVSPTDLERLLGFIYSLFLMSGIIYTTLHLILGIGFIKLGSKNRESGGILIMLGGVLYVITWIINIVGVVIQKYGGWYNPIFLYSISGILIILVWTLYVISIASVGIILIYSFFTKRPLFIIFGILFFTAYFIEFLSFLGII